MDRVQLIRIRMYGRRATKMEQQNTTVLIKTTTFGQIKQAANRLSLIDRVGNQSLRAGQ